MTLPTRSKLPSRWSVPCVALLAFASGCTGGSDNTSELYPVLDQRGLITYRYMNTAPPVPEVATTLTAAQLRQQWQEDEEVRQWGRDQEADEAMRRRIRQDQEWQELRRRQEEQAYQDQIRRNLRAQGWRERQPAYHQQWTVRRAEAEAMQLQQGSQALDKVLQQMQQQQQEMLYRRQQEILNRQYR